MAKISKLALKIAVIIIMFTLLSGCSAIYARKALKIDDTVLIDKYIRYIDNYLYNETEFVFSNSKELKAETLYEFSHFIDAKDKLNIVKYDDGKFYLTEYGTDYILDMYFKSAKFNKKDIIAFDHNQKVFIGPKRNYNFLQNDLECIYLSSKQMVKGNLVLVADYYDPFDINKLNKLYSKTYTIKLSKDGYKYISVTKTEHNNTDQQDDTFYINYYLRPIVNAKLVSSSWKNAEQIDANRLLTFAYIPFINSNISHDEFLKEDGKLHIPADKVEKQLYQKFELPEHFLKLTDAYNPLDNCYVGDFTFDTSYNPHIELIDFTKIGDDVYIQFTVNDVSDKSLKTISLHIAEQNEGYKYVSCEVK